MMEPFSQYDLKSNNTLAIASVAEYFLPVTNSDELIAACNWAKRKSLPLTIIGGGSNLVLKNTVQGLVVHNCIPGINLLTDGDDFSLVEVGAGENWHNFVLNTLAMGLSGLENLSLIPGTAGAAPVQNIGAYGVELKDYFHSLTAWDQVAEHWVEFDLNQCQFGYRDSIFKRNAGRYLISTVRFKLPHQFNAVLGYGPLEALLKSCENITALEVSNKICQIRSEKLPSPDDIPNAGSFFKNPLVTGEKYQALLEAFPDLVSYRIGENYKLAAGWLLDRAGFKGYRDPESGVGMHDKQALVLVNPNGASAQSLLSTVADIQKSIFNLYQIQLEVEPVILGE